MMASDYALMCIDGCALTLWESDLAATQAFISHGKTGHRGILLAPGTYEMPSGFTVRVGEMIGELK